MAIAGVPIFVPVRDRLTALRQSLAGFAHLRPAPLVVVHDFGSTWAPMLDALEELAEAGVMVVRSRAGSLDAEAAALRETIAGVLAQSGARHYAVARPGIVLDPGAPDALAVYARLLDRFGDVEAVGPMLRIDDIPDAYPLKLVAAGEHYYAFWRHEPVAVRLGLGHRVRVQNAPVEDFALYRRDTIFRRGPRRGLRVHAPYWARRFDWYLDPDALPEDERYHLARTSASLHWSAAWSDVGDEIAGPTGRRIGNVAK